jgi:hypothetical protein
MILLTINEKTIPLTKRELRLLLEGANAAFGVDGLMDYLDSNDWDAFSSISTTLSDELGL